MEKGVLRKLLIIAFFINTMALFITHFGIAKYPCDPDINPNEWCIGELNPLQSGFIGGGFVFSLIYQLSFWGMVFCFFEYMILGKAQHAWIFPAGLMLILSIDLFNDIVVILLTNSL